MVSIVIPVYNQHEMTNQCIESIKAHTEDYEVIIVDNGSTPEFKCDIAEVIYNKENLGFPKAVNQGIRVASGKNICLLNNDTVVTSQWIKKLISRLNNGYSIVGPMTNYVAGLQKAFTATYEDEGGLQKASEEWSKRNKGKTQDVDFVIGFCMLFKRSLFEELGDFDESMWPCSGEEIDFCFRARAAGHRVGIARDVYIHHYGSQTFQEMQDAGQLNYQSVCRDCDKHIARKWGGGFWERQGAVENTRLVRLNLGCGAYKLPGFVNIDKSKKILPDLVSDAMNLPYDHESIDEIYCGHMLEHLSFDEGEKALKYWQSLLKPGGKLLITVPDFDILAKDYLENPTPQKLRDLNDVYIYSYCQPSHHKYCYSGNLLKQILLNTGFTEVKKLPVDHEYFVSPVLWQTGYEGRKAA